MQSTHDLHSVSVGFVVRVRYARTRVSRKMKSVVCSSVDLSNLVRNLSTDLDFLKLPFMLLFCVPGLQ